ncbi:MAG: M1 family metallopeptidase [Anaerolineales bacterium]|nr:M1 family metallopeptidase [Anaerolineales bacterium]
MFVSSACGGDLVDHRPAKLRLAAAAILHQEGEQALDTVEIGEIADRTAFPPVTDTPRPPTATIDVTGTAVTEAARSRTKYDLRVEFDYSRHSLSAAQTITYTNQTGMSLAELPIIVNPNLQPGVFTLESVVLNRDEPLEAFTLEKSDLVLPLSSPLGPDETVILSLAWQLRLLERSGELGYTELQANMMDWYPYIPPYSESQGWIVNKPWPYGEYLTYEASDFRVQISLVGPEEPIIAAGAPANEIGDKVIYELKGARSFAWSASPHYQARIGQAGPVEVTVYTYPGHQDAGEAVLEAGIQALELFNERFGPYPHPVFTIVEASFSDGMEFDGLIFLSQGYIAEYDGTPQTFMTVLTVHETAHQWWFGGVGNDQAMEPWIDEALSTYSELIFYERYYPELIDWWWLFRVNYFNPQGFINGSIYDYGRFEPYFNAVYHRGAQFHRDIRAAMGDEAYYSFLRTYADDYRLELVSGRDFLGLLQESSPVDLQGILAGYFGPQN